MIGRSRLLFGILILLVGTSACVRDVKVARQEPPISTMTVDALVDRLNQLAETQRSLNAPVSLVFRDLREATVGRNKQYPAADGRLVLERPDNIRLQIKAPVVGKRIADMASDGDSFRVKVLWPDDKRKYIIGRNRGRYKRVEAGATPTDPALQQAGTLANIRPQHLTDAFLIQPVALDGAETVYFLDEVRQTERDTRPGAKKGAEVVKPYYVLTLLERIDAGPEARVLRRLWFDRTVSGTELARQEFYEEGHLATLVTYGNYFTASSGQSWPGLVTIERVEDGYAVDARFDGTDLRINPEVRPEVFELANEEALPELDLDQLPSVIENGDQGT